MKVLIVAKTRMGSGACIGGIAENGRSARLIAPDASFNNQFNKEYNVGEIWDIEFTPDPHIIPPHTENLIVQRKQLLASQEQNIADFIVQHMPPKTGGLERLYDGLVQMSPSGPLYIAKQSGVPSYSTLFWRADRPLLRDTTSKRIRYRYPTETGGHTLTFVGFQEPIAEIPAGTLLRISLAHWWQPPDDPTIEPRCYLQLSGWFLPENDTQKGIKKTPKTTETPKKIPDIPLSTAQTTLKQVFGFDEFRPMQADVVQNMLQKRDTLAVMPTGSGKSLCYQLPALLFPGLTVVVSPLISLMQDQVEQLRELGITAVFLNSTLTHSQYQQTTHQIRNGAAKLLYAAPETLLRPETLLLLEQCPVDCLTIDEAHCISEWGHDFRPEYRQLADMRRRLPQAVCLAVTATATEQVRRDIKTSLHIGEAGEFIASFDRANLHLTVQPRTDGLGQVTAFLEAHRGESGIIYCTTRKQVDILTNQLAALGWPVLPYHAGMDDSTRQQHQRQFSQDDVPIMVATIAFGMGINKSNVRFIVHYDLPKNLESYYQQIGRAGRDGLPADCLLLYSPSDVQTIYHFMQQQEPDRQKVAYLHLQAMLGFVETTVCRRRPLLTYFGESYTADTCNTCDNCLSDEAAPDDLTLPAQKFLSCVKRTGEFFGVNHIIDVLRGSQSQAVLAKGHDKLTTYNIGGEFSKKEWQYLARQFVQQGLLTQDMEFGSLKLTSKAYEVFKGGAVHGLLPNHELSGRPKPGTNYDMALFELLRAKRKSLADENDVPPFMVLSDRSLMEMAMYLPQTEPALAELHGMGQFKVQKYGAAFLAVIRPYCAEHNLVEKRKTAVSAPTTTSRKNRTEEVVEWYNNGRSIPKIAEMFTVKQSTIVDHLWKAVQNGQTVRPDNLLHLSHLSPDIQKQVVAAFAELGLERLRPVFDALGETVPFDELHLIRLHIATQNG